MERLEEMITGELGNMSTCDFCSEPRAYTQKSAGLELCNFHKNKICPTIEKTRCEFCGNEIDWCTCGKGGYDPEYD